MSSFSAQLHVASHIFSVLHCTYQTSQATDSRGRVVAKVHCHPVEVLLDVPDHDFLVAWAADPHKRLAADIIFRADATGSGTESLSLAAAYCVGYREIFTAGDTTTGAYQCVLSLSDPDGFTLSAGAPRSGFVAPAAGTHGSPITASSLVTAAASAIDSDCPPAVHAMLQKQVDLMCQSQGTRCSDTDTCSLLLEKIARAEACIAARRAINDQCFKGGDEGHKEAVKNRENGVRRCQGIYLRQCGNLPQPVPLPAPSSTPSEQPDDGKYGPTTLAGAALIIFFILTAPFRTAPN